MIFYVSSFTIMIFPQFPFIHLTHFLLSTLVNAFQIYLPTYHTMMSSLFCFFFLLSLPRWLFMEVILVLTTSSIGDCAPYEL